MLYPSSGQSKRWLTWFTILTVALVDKALAHSSKMRYGGLIDLKDKKQRRNEAFTAIKSLRPGLRNSWINGIQRTCFGIAGQAAFRL